jgi:TPR repeat protein
MPTGTTPSTEPANVVSAPAREAEAAPSEETTTPETACPDKADPAEGQRDYQQGLAFLEQSREGEHYLREPYEKAISLLESAARKGHLEAQARFGSVQFGNMMTNDAPQPKDEESYVSALTFLRVAALRGHAEATSYVPGLDALGLDEKGNLRKPVPEPLDQFPPAWIRRVVVESDAWMACERAR